MTSRLFKNSNIASSHIIKLLILCIVIKLCSNSASLKVNELTDDNFEEHRLKHEYVLIYFHANYSVESKNLQAQFNKLPFYLKTEKDMIYAIITQKHYLVNHKYNVEFPYPKIILVNKDNYWEYKDEMKTVQIAEWVERKINKQIQKLYSLEELANNLNNLARLILLVGEESKIDQYSKITNLTDTYTDLHFYYTDNVTIVQNLKIDDKLKNLDEKIIIMKNYDDLINVYSSPIFNNQNNDKIVKFIRTFAYPLHNYFSPNNYLYAVNNRNSFSVLILPKEISDEKLNLINDEYYKSAIKLRGDLFFMYGNFSDQSQTTISLDFEIGEKDLPIIIIQQFPLKNEIIKRFKLTDINSEARHGKISEFFDKFKYGALRRFLKSEKVDTENYNLEDNFYKLVRRNFEEFLFSNYEKEYGLVFFTRRNCGPCVEYQKEFLKIARTLRGKIIKFGIIDGLMNEFDEFETPGFPSVMLFKPGKNKLKSPIIFESLLNFANLDGFIKKEMHTDYYIRSDL